MYKVGDILKDKDNNIFYVLSEDSDFEIGEYIANFRLHEKYGIIYGSKISLTIKHYKKPNPAELNLFMQLLHNTKYSYDFKDHCIKIDLYHPDNKLKEMDIVLVRNRTDESWFADIFSHVYKDCIHKTYKCLHGEYKFCIPYKGNEKLFQTTKTL